MIANVQGYVLASPKVGTYTALWTTSQDPPRPSTSLSLNATYNNIFEDDCIIFTYACRGGLNFTLDSLAPCNAKTSASRGAPLGETV